MMKKLLIAFSLVWAMWSCSDNDSFTQSSSARLTFEADTLVMDTVFSGMGSMTYSVWIHNYNDDGLRLSSVRLSGGNQTGFRVNVDGTYLDNSTGAVATGLEVRGGDSLRVFVELTPPETMQLEPKELTDQLVFRLESGVEQRMVLQAWAWDAEVMHDVRVSSDQTISSQRPIVIYGGITIDSTATLTISHTTLYFHDGAGIEVYGRLLTDSVVMRGDRLDRMFPYLPYDRVSGQWRGVTFRSSSFGNTLINTEIRNASNAIVCDSAEWSSDVLRLTMEHCVVHNSNGPGLMAVASNVSLTKCQVTNALGPLVSVYGGQMTMVGCTLGQFYPFSAMRGAAILLSNVWQGSDVPLRSFVCDSSIVTGYADDVLEGVVSSIDTVAFDYHFMHSLLRTPKVEDEDSVHYEGVMWESPKDSIQGKKHFVLIDEQNLIYDFHLDSLSTAQGLGCY